MELEDRAASRRRGVLDIVAALRARRALDADGSPWRQPGQTGPIWMPQPRRRDFLGHGSHLEPGVQGLEYPSNILSELPNPKL